MRHFVVVPFLVVSAVLLSVKPAAAQFVGTFTWLTAPYCNVITLNVTQTGTVYTVEGFDNLCGADRRATATGVATLNQNGSVGIGLTIVNPLEVEPSHIDVDLNVATLSGTWEDGAGRTGAFTFNGVPAGVNQRPIGQAHLTMFGDTPALIGRRANGTPGAPTAVESGDTLLFLGARGHVGTGISGVSEAQIILVADENWTPTARGTRIQFLTTANGTTGTSTKLTVDSDGQVGIGTAAPIDLLDVAGDIRIGTGTNGCLKDRDASVIAGVCSSDARFKRDISSFQPMLNKVASLRPVNFYWRASEFPAKGFGERVSYGLVAQEVEQLLPELVTTDAEGYKAVNYSKLPLLALQAIKELKAENDALRAEMERRLAAVEAQMRAHRQQ